MKTTLEVQGLKELEAGLSSVGAVTGVKILRSAVRAAIKPMLAEAKNRAPYDEDDTDGYHLRDAMRIQTEPKRSRKNTVEFRLGPARETGGKNTIIKGGLGKSAKAPNYAQIAERLTPFLRPAFDNNYRKFISLLKSGLQKKIEKAARKANKK